MTTREIRTIRGQKVIVVRCLAGHSFRGPNKGLVRASAAAWETRHQDCKPPKGDAQ